MAENQQPIYILPQDSTRNRGRDAQRNNIAAGKLVGEIVKATLGPKGMDKMLVDSMGDIIVTNDGVTILEQMQIEHPAAKMVVEVAKTQEKEVGDGTTSAVIIAGQLLHEAEQLLDKEIHPTIINKGYRMAEERTMELLNKIAENLSRNDTATLKKIAMTAMTGKGAESSKDLLADLAVQAVTQVAEETDGKLFINLDDVKVEKKVGASTECSELIKGLVIDKERVSSSMPRQIKNAKVALLDCALEVRETETDTKIQIDDPAKLQAFMDMEEKQLMDMVEKIKASGATVVFSQKGIDDLVQHYLAKAGIYAARRVKKSDIDKLARATGAKIVTKVRDLTKDDLGFTGLVEEVKMNDEELTFVRQCKNPKSVTILVRGGTEHVVDEIARAVQDAIGDLSAALKSGKVVAGGGACEIEIAQELRNFATTLDGREQLAVQGFANAVEALPRILAENSGIDPIDILTDLHSKHKQKDGKWYGIDVFKRKVADTWKMGVIEPLKIKTQAITSATEVATMILRIDDIIASGPKNQNMPKGMGNMNMPEM